MASPKFCPPVLCLDLIGTMQLLWSVAHARAVQGRTMITWQPYRESAVLNAIYAVMSKLPGYGSPGTAEVTQDEAGILKLTDQYWDGLMDTFLRKATDESRPDSLHKWMESQVKIRQDALQSTQEIFQTAAEINREIADKTATGIKRLAQIHLASSIALAGMSCGISLAGAGVEIVASSAVTTAYGVAGDVIKGWGHSGRAKVIAIGVTKELGKDARKEALHQAADKAAEKGVEASTHWALNYLPKIRAAEAKVARYSAEVARKVKFRKAKIANRRFNQAMAQKAEALQGARKAIRVTKATRVVQRSIPVIFAAWDVLDAIHDYQEETGGGE